MRNFILICILLILNACSGNSEKDRYVSIVEEWQGKQIVLPDGMTDFLTGETIDLSDADFTILTYVDSTGCTGCKMKLALWKEYLNSIQNNYVSCVEFVMVVNSEDSLTLSETLNRYSFEHNVHWDRQNVLDRKYNFPKDSRFQTFLLGRTGKVLAIGSPAQNSDLEMLYNSIISGKTTVSDNLTSAITVSDNIVNLGKIKKYETRSKGISISNNGNDTIKIANVLTSCDCVDLTFQEDFILPHSDINGSLDFKGDSIAGDFERTVKIYYLGFEYPSVINISGNIITQVGSDGMQSPPRKN